VFVNVIVSAGHKGYSSPGLGFSGFRLRDSGFNIRARKPLQSCF
jgi:hypothetical protein